MGKDLVVPSRPKGENSSVSYCLFSSNEPKEKSNVSSICQITNRDLIVSEMNGTPLR